MLRVVARNRRTLLQCFREEHKKRGEVSIRRAKEIIYPIIKEQAHVEMTDKNWTKLLKFADRNGAIDYEFLLEVFKQRLESLVAFPLSP